MSPADGPPQPESRAALRARQGFRDVAISAAVLGLGILVIELLAGPHGSAHPVAVPLEAPLASFAQAAPYDPLLPAGLPPTWVATSVSFPTAASLRIGWVTPAHAYASLQESDEPGAVAQAAPGQLPQGDVTIRSAATGTVAPWQRLAGHGSSSLVYRAGAVTVVLGGTAGEAELERLAAALHPAR